jgi:4a-hydroxytetrahydrobiopterin dehydratase
MAEEKYSGGKCHTCIPDPSFVGMSQEEIGREFLTLAPWSLWKLDVDGKYLSRDFICRNWKAAIEVIQAVSEIAESRDMLHHPDIHLTDYRNLEIRVFTHAVGGLTPVDFKLARAIDHIKIDFSPKWLKANPEATHANANK